MSPFAPAQIDVILDDVIMNVVSDPISAILIGVGSLLVGFASLLFGYLTLRGVIAGFVPRSGNQPSQPK